jgi:Na+/H+-dicarboxylate symporter
MVKKIPLWKQVVIALILGGIFGAAIGEWAANIRFVGEIFINLIMMVIVPLVFFSIVSGIISLGDPKLLGRMGLKAFGGYVLTTIIAITVAIVLANFMNPGEGVPVEVASKLEDANDFADIEPMERPTVADILISIIPTNAVEAMAERHILQVIFFAVFVGVVMVLLKGKTPRMEEIVHEAASIFYKIIDIVINLAPLAVFALTAWAVGALGIDAVISLLQLVLTVLLACLLQYGVLCLALGIFGLNPIHFIRKAVEFQVIAFSTSSSGATIPTTMRVAEQGLGVSKTTASMVVPLGATVNMNGTAMYLAVAAVFVAQFVGIQLTADDYVVITTTITLVAIGTAAVPGGSIVMMPIVFASVGLPVEAIALILGVDRILDMFRTTINVTGDAVVSAVIDKTENTLDEKAYNA